MTSIFPRLDCFHVSEAEKYEIKVTRVTFRVHPITWSLQSSLCQMKSAVKVSFVVFFRDLLSMGAR